MRRSTNETRRPCQDWLNGSALRSGTLQRTSAHAHPHQPLQPSFDLDERTAARVHTLIAEGALLRACTALTADPLVSPIPAVIDELRLLHPGPTAAHRDMIEKLRPVGPGAVTDVDPDLAELWQPSPPHRVQGLAGFAPRTCRMLCAIFLATRQ